MTTKPAASSLGPALPGDGSWVILDAPGEYVATATMTWRGSTAESSVGFRARYEGLYYATTNESGAQIRTINAGGEEGHVVACRAADPALLRELEYGGAAWTPGQEARLAMVEQQVFPDGGAVEFISLHGPAGGCGGSGPEIRVGETLVGPHGPTRRLGNISFAPGGFRIAYVQREPGATTVHRTYANYGPDGPNFPFPSVGARWANPDGTPALAAEAPPGPVVPLRWLGYDAVTWHQPLSPTRFQIVTEGKPPATAGPIVIAAPEVLMRCNGQIRDFVVVRDALDDLVLLVLGTVDGAGPVEQAVLLRADPTTRECTVLHTLGSSAGRQVVAFSAPRLSPVAALLLADDAVDAGAGVSNVAPYVVDLDGGAPVRVGPYGALPRSDGTFAPPHWTQDQGGRFLYATAARGFDGGADRGGIAVTSADGHARLVAVDSVSEGKILPIP